MLSIINGYLKYVSFILLSLYLPFSSIHSNDVSAKVNIELWSDSSLMNKCGYYLH